MDLHLVSFPTCPFVQRSVITLREKGVDFDITYIDLFDPPQWFKEDSPLGKVPILKTDGKVLFESAVINEYVDDVTPGRLMPEDAWDKAQTRAWIEFASQTQMDYYQAATALEQEGFEEHREALKDKLGRLQGRFVGPWFLGDDFTLADAAMAPLMMRLEQFSEIADGFDLADFPQLAEWKDRLVARDSVAGSIVEDWKERNLAYLAKRGGYVARAATTA